MYKFVCGYCGKIVDADRPNKLYCDSICKAAAARKRRQELQPEDGCCVFNSGVACDDQEKCATCGWNPAVAELRKERLGV